MMDFRKTIRTLVAHRTDELVIVPFTPSLIWEELSRRPELDLPYFGSMGKAASTGLGVALAVPDLKVWVLDGDGSLLMNLGCLVTTAHLAPPNLYHFVVENGIYATTGGQPIPMSQRVRFSELARGAGFPAVFEFDDLAALERELAGVLATPGPVFVTLKVTPELMSSRVPNRTTRQALPEVWAEVSRRAGAA